MTCVPIPHHPTLPSPLVIVCFLLTITASLFLPHLNLDFFFHSLNTFLVSDILGYFGPSSSPFLSLEHSPFLLLHGSLSCSLSLFLLSYPHFILFMFTIFAADARVWIYVDAYVRLRFLISFSVLLIDHTSVCVTFCAQWFSPPLWHIMCAGGDEWVHISLLSLFTHLSVSSPFSL